MAYSNRKQYEIRLPLVNDGELFSLYQKEHEIMAELQGSKEYPHVPNGTRIIAPGSPLKDRRAAEMIARYFKREKEYDFLQYDAKENMDKDRIILFIGSGVYSRYETYAYGGVCFRWRHWKDRPASFSLDWAWLHPFERNRKHMTKAWPYFEARFGEFIVMPPVSAAMRSVMNKVGYKYPMSAALGD